jgi:hypothetical protein
MAHIRQFRYQIDKLRPRDVSALKITPSRSNRKHRLRIEDNVNRAIEYAQVRVPEMRLQPLGFDQKLGMGKTRETRRRVSLQVWGEFSLRIHAAHHEPNS